MLGQVLADLQRFGEGQCDGNGVTVLDAHLDIVVLARAHAAAARAGESLDAYIARAVRRFLDSASEDEWAQLMGRLRDGEAAGSVSVDLMLRRALKQDGERA